MEHGKKCSCHPHPHRVLHQKLRHHWAMHQASFTAPACQDFQQALTVTQPLAPPPDPPHSHRTHLPAFTFSRTLTRLSISHRKPRSLRPGTGISRRAPAHAALRPRFAKWLRFRLARARCRYYVPQELDVDALRDCMLVLLMLADLRFTAFVITTGCPHDSAGASLLLLWLLR